MSKRSISGNTKPVATTFPYTIVQNYRKGADTFSVRPYGDFLSIIDFTILPTSNINGIIFQKITKITRVIYTKSGQIFILMMDSEIDMYTNQNVRFMCTTYLEYFRVVNGIVENGDVFSNGSISEYLPDPDPTLPNYADLINASFAGIIKQKGECVFISDNSPNYASIVGAGWRQDVNHASNGLYFVDNTVPNTFGSMDNLWNAILADKQSEEVLHIVEHYWHKHTNNANNPIHLYYETINKPNLPDQYNLLGRPFVCPIATTRQEEINNVIQEIKEIYHAYNSKMTRLPSVFTREKKAKTITDAQSSLKSLGGGKSKKKRRTNRKRKTKRRRRRTYKNKK
jgi:hypothetical protein